MVGNVFDGLTPSIDAFFENAMAGFEHVSDNIDNGFRTVFDSISELNAVPPSNETASFNQTTITSPLRTFSSVLQNVFGSEMLETMSDFLSQVEEQLANVIIEVVDSMKADTVESINADEDV